MSDVPFFEADRAIESLRESDFDANSAFGEVIDNSIQANATTVNIQFETTNGGRRNDITAIAFGDDGIGMNADTLHNCMTLGWSSRFNDRDGIGRFGVGMTLAAIHECRRIEIWSKASGNDWLFTYLDLDEIKAGTLDAIPKPTHRTLPSEFKELPGKDHGTLVVWRKIDRQQENADGVIDNFRVWCGRTFRYFIWDAIPPRKLPVAITINRELVAAIDPLYVRTEKTRFPTDPPAHEYEEMDINWVADSNSPHFEEGKKAAIRIRMSVIDESLRLRQGDGRSPKATARFIHKNNGISILRSHREVYYGEIPYWGAGVKGWPNFEEIDRWWGCEVLFTPEMDRAFQVKNIKRGAIPTRNLRMTIKEKILPTRKSVLEQVRELWERNKLADKEAAESKDGENLLKRAGDHDEAEKTAKKTALPKSQLDVGKDLEEESKAAAERYSDRFDEEERQKLIELFKSQPFTIMQDTWSGQQFFESKFLGGNAVLDYNMSHNFWKTVYDLVDRLGSEDEDHIEVAKEIRVMLDLLIIAYAKAESSFGLDAEYTADEFIQHLRGNWGQMLYSFVNARLKELEEQ